MLLDTHAFLWWVADDSSLSDSARSLIGDPANEVFVSAASAWEIAIETGIGKLQLPEVPERYVPDRIVRNAFQALPSRYRTHFGSASCRFTTGIHSTGCWWPNPS